MEIADVFIVNKADLPGTEKLERELKTSLTLAHRPDGWTPKVIAAVASEGRGITDVLAAAREFRLRGTDSERPAKIWAARLREMFRERLLEAIPAEEFTAAGKAVAERRADPYSVLDAWSGQY